MRKVTFFLTLLLTFAGVTSASAQAWRPTQRATELKAGTMYMLYNTAWGSASDDRTGFLFKNGNDLGHSGSSHKKPATFATSSNAYLWKIESTGGECKYEYYMKNVSSNTYVDPAGKTNNTTGVNLYIQPWMTSQAPKSGVSSEAADGTLVANSDITDITGGKYLFTICGTGLTSNGESNGNGDCWNGNNGSWAKWSDSHPYAFYEVEQVRTAEEVAAYNTAKQNLDNAAILLPFLSGLVTSADKYTTNALQTTEGSLAALLDGTYETYFHSRYDGDAVNENHYLQAELSEAKASIRFYLKKRHNNNANRPTTIKILGSNDGTDFTEITTINSGLPTDESVLDYYSPVISPETAYKYYRFVVTATNTGAVWNGNPFFTMSEFYVLDGENETINNLIEAKEAFDNLAWYDDANFTNTVQNAENASASVQEVGAPIRALQNAITRADAYISDGRIGPGLNQYTQAAGDRNLAEALAEAKTLYSNADATLTEKGEMAATLTTLVTNLTINLPAPNNFYRIRCTATGMKRLLSDVNSTNNRLTLEGGTQNVNSIFYYNNDKLLAYTNGLFMNKMEFDAAGGEGAVVTFSDGASTRVGTYFFQCGDRWLYGDGTTLDSGSSHDARAGYVWWLEPVNALPVHIGETGFATLWAPVALTIPAGVKAYTATLDEAENALVLEEVEGTIPANTGVVLKGEAASDPSFTITTTTNTLSSRLTGQANTIPYSKSATNKVYTLQRINDDQVGFKAYNGAQLSGFKARFEAAAISGVQALSLIWGETTGIGSVVKEGDKVNAVFDLSGRRVAAPAKGTYIVNGKKVIFK